MVKFLKLQLNRMVETPFLSCNILQMQLSVTTLSSCVVACFFNLCDCVTFSFGRLASGNEE